MSLSHTQLTLTCLYCSNTIEDNSNCSFNGTDSFCSGKCYLSARKSYVQSKSSGSVSSLSSVHHVAELTGIKINKGANPTHTQVDPKPNTQIYYDDLALQPTPEPITIKSSVSPVVAPVPPIQMINVYIQPQPENIVLKSNVSCIGCGDTCTKDEMITISDVGPLCGPKCYESGCDVKKGLKANPYKKFIITPCSAVCAFCEYTETCYYENSYGQKFCKIDYLIRYGDGYAHAMSKKNPTEVTINGTTYVGNSWARYVVPYLPPPRRI